MRIQAFLLYFLNFDCQISNLKFILRPGIERGRGEDNIYKLFKNIKLVYKVKLTGLLYYIFNKCYPSKINEHFKRFIFVFLFLSRI